MLIINYAHPLITSRAPFLTKSTLCSFNPTRATSTFTKTHYSNICSNTYSNTYSNVGNARSTLLKSTNWDAMYYGTSTTPSQYPSSTSKPSPTPVKVITFDLDDTIWATSPTIKHANDKLTKFLEEEFTGMEIPPVYIVMKNLYSLNPSAYYKVFESDDIKKNDDSDDGDDTFGGRVAFVGPTSKREPVYLTKLRVDAVAYIHSILNGPYPKAFDEDAELELPEVNSPSYEFARRAFKVWRNGRHEGCSLHMAKDAGECLKNLKREGFVVGAITNGNGDPREVEGIEGVWDFVVKSEDVGIGKPDALIYQRGISEGLRVLRDGGDSDVLAGVDTSVGGWWVHVGDDLVKDCVAGKGMGMRTIYVSEFVKKDAEFDDKGVHVVGMAKRNGGTEGGGYLESGIREDFVDVEVERFRDVEGVVKGWIKEWEEFVREGGVGGEEGGEEEVGKGGDDQDVTAERDGTDYNTRLGRIEDAIGVEGGGKRGLVPRLKRCEMEVLGEVKGGKIEDRLKELEEVI